MTRSLLLNTDQNHSSTIVEVIERHCQSELSSTPAYFYFDFNDSEKQKSSSLLRSLLTQLSISSHGCPEVLTKLYAECIKREQQPTDAALLTALKSIVGLLEHVYIIVDALDECSDQDELLAMITEISNWKLTNLHLIATSRRERNIEDGLTQLITAQINLGSDLVDADIQIHLSSKLDMDPKFKKWTADERLEIKDTLMQQANGMWVFS